MDRYRIGLLGVVAVVVAAVLIFGLHLRAGTDSANAGQTGPAAAGAPDPDLIPEGQRPAAPEFTGITGWLNSAPLRLASLRGQVVLIDFWTFSCVNCVNTLPHLRAINAQFGPQGLTIVGVHSPEFDFEKSPSNVAAAVKHLDVTWPVALDPNMATWNAWSNQYWPAEYLIDKNGAVAYYHFGEGDYDRTERAIVSLLGTDTSVPTAAPVAVDPALTPELYAGSGRGHLDGKEQFGAAGVSTRYPDPGPPTAAGAIEIVGSWADQVEYIEATAAGHARLRFHGADLYIVAESRSNQALQVTVTLDGKPVDAAHSGPDLTGQSMLSVSRSDLYHVLTGVGAGEHLIDLAVPAGFRLYTFTFE